MRDVGPPTLIAPPAELLRKYGLKPRHSFGQNFLHDRHSHEAIVQASGARPGTRVLEIGPGLGTITGALLATGAHVGAIERDRDMCRVLRTELAGVDRFELFEADAVRFDYESYCRAGDPPIIVGNLPYHITGPLLFALLRVAHLTGPWVIMIQKEVAQRLASPPGSRAYSSATVAISRVRRVSRVREVPRGAFIPAPKVDSTILRLDPLDPPLAQVADEKRFQALVRTIFTRRRKTVLNALGGVVSRELAPRLCAEADVPVGVRPEVLTVQQFGALCRAFEGAVERGEASPLGAVRDTDDDDLSSPEGADEPADADAQLDEMVAASSQEHHARTARAGGVGVVGDVAGDPRGDARGDQRGAQQPASAPPAALHSATSEGGAASGVDVSSTASRSRKASIDDMIAEDDLGRHRAYGRRGRRS